jgi:hypothetical protein
MHAFFTIIIINNKNYNNNNGNNNKYKYVYIGMIIFYSTLFFFITNEWFTYTAIIVDRVFSPTRSKKSIVLRLEL